MKPNITIELFRVSSDGKYLDMIVECPERYHFTKLNLEARVWDPEDKKYKSQYFIIGEDAFGEQTGDDKTLRIPLSVLGIDQPAIYKGIFTAELDDETSESSECINVTENWAGETWTENNYYNEWFNLKADRTIVAGRSYTMYIQMPNPDDFWGWNFVNEDGTWSKLELTAATEATPSEYREYSREYTFTSDRTILAGEQFALAHSGTKYISEGTPSLLIGFTCVESVETDPCNKDPEEIETTAICSDVGPVYRCILDGVLNSACATDCSTGTVSDDVIRNYLVLYGHTAAMQSGDLETAELYFRMLTTCFNLCKPCCSCGKKPKIINSCGCK